MVVNHCEVCGKLFFSISKKALYCEECRKKKPARRIEWTKERACDICGKAFVAKQRSMKTCPACRKKEREKTAPAHYARCRKCGKLFLQIKREGICGVCSANSEKSTAYCAKWPKPEAKQEPQKPMCKPDLQSHTKAAAELRMSYGKYMAMKDGRLRV